MKLLIWLTVFVITILATSLEVHLCKMPEWSYPIMFVCNLIWAKLCGLLE